MVDSKIEPSSTVKTPTYGMTDSRQSGSSSKEVQGSTYGVAVNQVTSNYQTPASSYQSSSVSGNSGVYGTSLSGSGVKYQPYQSNTGNTQNVPTYQATTNSGVYQSGTYQSGTGTTSGSGVYQAGSGSGVYQSGTSVTSVTGTTYQGGVGGQTYQSGSSGVAYQSGSGSTANIGTSGIYQSGTSGITGGNYQSGTTGVSGTYQSGTSGNTGTYQSGTGTSGYQSGSSYQPYQSGSSYQSSTYKPTTGTGVAGSSGLGGQSSTSSYRYEKK